MTADGLAKKLLGFHHFRDFSHSDLELERLAKLIATCKSPYPGKYRRMGFRETTLGSPDEDALAYINEHFPHLRAQRDKSS